jgi:hypothetical protein
MVARAGGRDMFWWHMCCCAAAVLQITEAQQQWWSFKSSNFDSVLLFKVGKFYEVKIKFSRGSWMSCKSHTTLSLSNHSQSILLRHACTNLCCLILLP